MAPFTPTHEQLLAIDWPGDMVLVAKPGSGKTGVLSLKIRRLLPTLKPFQGVIAISYTNKASEELERRCKTGAFDVKRSFFGTIDDFFLREIIRPFAGHVMAAADAPKTVKFSELPDAVTLLNPATPVIAEAVPSDTVHFLPLLEAALAQGFIPLEAVGMLAFHIASNSAACRRYLKARYKAVFIDEYQDSGAFQHRVFLGLKHLGLTAVAVGDVDQSIYAFARKDARFLKALTRPESGFMPFHITLNHRSHPSISDFALRLLDPNHPLAPTNDLRVLEKTVKGTQTEIGQWLTTAIPRLMTEYGVESAGQVAILCRTEHSARTIAAALGLAHRVAENNPFDKISAAEGGLLSDLLRLRFDKQLSAETLIERAGLASLNAARKRALRRSILACRDCAKENLVIIALEAARQLLEQPASAEADKILTAVCTSPASLLQFQPRPADAIQIMTLHKAKGLEFGIVFHTDLYDHILPKQTYDSNQPGPVFEDEQQCLNLHYVGITRAIHACVLLTSTKRLNGQNTIKNGSRSQFLGRHDANATPIPW